MSPGRSDRRKRLLVNEWEARTDAALAEAADRCGVWVFPKIRVADVLDLDQSGLSDETYRYGFKAHTSISSLPTMRTRGANSLLSSTNPTT
jgi:hypothetical protein